MINSIIFTRDNMIISKGIYSRKKPKIISQIILEYPENSYANDEILDSVKLSHAIIAALKKNKMKTNNVVFAIQHADINIVDLNVPYVKKYMQQAVHAKLTERYIGVLDKNLISYKIAKIEGNLCTGTAVIAPRSLINAYYDLSLKLNMKLISIDYMGNILYKNMYYESKDFENKTFLIADMTSDEIIVHLYSDGLLRLSRSESGNILLSDDEPISNDFVFENKLSITNDDIVDIQKIFNKIKLDQIDLSAFYSTQNVFFKRYSSDADRTKEDVLAMENTLESIGSSLLDVKDLINREPDYTIVNEQHMRDYFKSIYSYFTKIGAFFKKTKVMNASFADEVETLLSTMLDNTNSIIEILDKYVVNEVNQKKLERRKIIQRICKLATNVILVADTSGQYPDITNIYIQGLILDASEKRLVSQNLAKHSDIDCSYYENWIQKENGLVLGSLYNEFRYFHDLNLSETLEKNDRINRNNYDNVIFGIGGAICACSIAFVCLGGFNMYSTYRMNNTISDNEAFIAKNKDVFELVNEVNTLNADISEIQNFQSYFDLARVNLNEVYYELKEIADGITIDGIGIDENFLITINAKASELKDISIFTEELTKKGYQNVNYTNISIEDVGYSVQVTYTYTPKEVKK